jgi:hypothetical protein
MSTATDTVHGRLDQLRTDHSPTQFATGLAVLAAIAFALVVLQAPGAHESLHDFRHAAGVVCH